MTTVDPLVRDVEWAIRECDRIASNLADIVGDPRKGAVNFAESLAAHLRRALAQAEQGPRVWSLPAEPEPEVTAVRCGCWPCRLIQPWSRHEDGEWRASTPEPAQHGYAWRWLVHDHGPLTDATGEAQ